MNNHSHQIRLQDGNWADQDWYNRTNAQGKRWRDIYINECGYMALEQDCHVNTHVDLINISSQLVHYAGPHRSLTHRELTKDSMREMLDTIAVVFYGK